MKTTILSIIALTAGSVLAQDLAPGRVLPDAYIVVLKNGASPSVVAARNSIRAKHTYNIVNGFSVDLPAPALAALLKDADVDMVVVDREVAAYARAPGGGGSTSSQIVPEGVKRIGAQNLAYNGAGVGVAVVDTGIDLAHADLNIGARSYSAVSTSAKDDNGHGTHCAGIIGARNNSLGVLGVAPASTVYAVKVLDRRGSGSDSTVLAGLNWILNNAQSVSPAINVVSMSLGRPGSVNDNPAYRSAVQALVNAGITVVVAAGNDCSLEVSQQVPASYPEVISVASTTAKAGASAYPGFAGIAGDTASFFSTDGASIAISAPGADQEDVSSTGGITSIGILSLKNGGGTTRMSGTSMACPHVAGVAALLYQKHGANSTPDNTRIRITSSASNLSAPYASPTSCFTYDGVNEGILSAVNALAAP